MNERISAIFFSLAALLAFASVASAQMPPDVVRLRDGGMIRGTILEHDPDSHVVIVLPSGEQRRVAAGEVQWAGPAREMPDAAPPAPPPAAAPPPVYAPPPPAYAPPMPPAGVALQLEANLDGLAVHTIVGHRMEARGRRGFGGTVRVSLHEIPEYGPPVCELPCSALFAPGYVALGFSRRGSHVVPLTEQVRLDGPRSLRVHWHDRSSLRLAGILALAVGIPAALAIAIPSTAAYFENHGRGEEWVGSIVGGVLLVVALAAGIPLAYSHDGVSLALPE